MHQRLVQEVPAGFRLLQAVQEHLEEFWLPVRVPARLGHGAGLQVLERQVQVVLEGGAKLGG